ncbi:MAG: ABC transporter ATP-binding protein [Bacteroidales bacterium]|nr:ABC transporter ATP-binding protein [Bacteroidales bacterium]
MIRIKNVSRKFGNVKALNHINLAIEKGLLFGLIGPDGAGKTTLLRLITTLLLPDEGKITVDGFDTNKDYKEIRKFIGYMPGRFSLYQDLSVEENLNFYATIFNVTVKENYHLIRDVFIYLEPFKKRLAKNLSGGMKQKLALSCALIHNPKILILDEPTTGVDAVSRKEFWENLKQLQKLNMTVLVSTPYMDEASMCDKVALIQSGTIMEYNTPAQIVSGYQKHLKAVRSENMHALLTDLREYPGCESAYLFGQYVHYTSEEKQTVPDQLTSFLVQKGHTEIQVLDIEPNIEDCFIASSAGIPNHTENIK